MFIKLKRRLHTLGFGGSNYVIGPFPLVVFCDDKDDHQQLQLTPYRDQFSWKRRFSYCRVKEVFRVIVTSDIDCKV